jgi:hypothetical protein
MLLVFSLIAIWFKEVAHMGLQEVNTNILTGN